MHTENYAGDAEYECMNHAGKDNAATLKKQ
jgi:hypothetical protein